MFYFWQCFCLKILSSESCTCTYTLVSSHFGSVWAAAEFCLQFTDSRMLIGTVSLFRFRALTGNFGLNQRLLPIPYVFHLLCAPFPLFLPSFGSSLLCCSSFLLGYALHVPFPLLARPRGWHISDVGSRVHEGGVGLRALHTHCRALNVPAVTWLHPASQQHTVSSRGPLTITAGIPDGLAASFMLLMKSSQQLPSLHI